MAIKIYGQKMTPKKAAQNIVADMLSQGLLWQSDTEPGQELVKVMTRREEILIEDQLRKILARIAKIIPDATF